MPDNGTSNHCNGLCSLKTHQLQAQVGGNKFAHGNCWLDIDFYTREDNSSRRFSLHHLHETAAAALNFLLL
jgi:hypothetical protein